MAELSPDRRVDPSIGRAIRAARLRRGMTQAALAGLAGISQGHLSKIEQGLFPVDKRSVLESCARALSVAPSDLTGSSFVVRTEAAEEDAALAPLRLAMAGTELGDETDPPPPWPQIEHRLAVMDALRPKADYAARNEMMPSLIADLYGSLDGPHRHEALVGLTACYVASEAAAKNLGSPDLAQVAALHLRDITAQLDGPEWQGLAAWGRVQAISSSARARAYKVATKAAAALQPRLDKPATIELYGMLHLASALAATVAGDLGQAATHVQEAEEAAQRPGAGTANFARLSFGLGNVGVWKTMLAVEAGEPGKAIETARKIDPSTLPSSPSRRAALHIDIGRAYAQERMPEKAVAAFRIAMELAPQRTHADPWIREMVTTMLTRARREAVQRDLRGLAHWLGVGR